MDKLLKVTKYNLLADNVNSNPYSYFCKMWKKSIIHKSRKLEVHWVETQTYKKEM